MKNLTIGIFHASGFGKELGKTGTKSDIVMCNRKTDDEIFTFMEPTDDKIIPKAQIMSVMDAAIISFEEITPAVGETVVMLNSMGIDKGIVLVPEYVDLKRAASLTKGTTLESFVVKQRSSQEVLDYLAKVNIERLPKPKIISIDHSFSVKGVGEVMLGFVRSGTLKKHDKLFLMPGNKEVVVRSIQMQDKDFDQAETGSRVGLAIKGATAEEMKRGYVLCESGSVVSSKEIKIDFEKNPFYKEEIKEKCHVIVGMQSLPAVISEEKITIEKEVVYRKGDVLLLLDLNAEKMHVIGKGKII